MFIYTISIAAAIFIIMIVVFRLIIHFHFCRRVSFRYPGEKIRGCPIWTHADSKGNRGNSEGGRKTATNSAQFISGEITNNGEDKKASPEGSRSQQNFSALSPEAPPR